MRPLENFEIAALRAQHWQAKIGYLHQSALIRKGWEVRDSTEPSGRRFLTDDELKLITAER
jgi:hypothetical protein